MMLHRSIESTTAYHGIEVLGRAIDDQGGGNGTVFYEAVMRWNQSDLGEVAVQQVVVERRRWQGRRDPLLW